MSSVFRVSWEMDIEAAHSAEAAEKALASLKDSNNIHTFFRVYSFPTPSPDTDRTLVGLMGPPFQLITLSDHLFFNSLFKKQTLYNFLPSGRWQLT